MDDVDKLLCTLQQLERALFAPGARHSGRLAHLLAEDFLEYGSSGRIYSKADVLSALGSEPLADITASGFSVRLIAPDTALLRYVACRNGDAYSLRSSIWQFRNAQWRMLFHQATPCARRV